MTSRTRADHIKPTHGILILVGSWIILTSVLGLTLAAGVAGVAGVATTAAPDSVSTEIGAPIYPTTWSHPSIEADDASGPGVFISHVPAWDYDTGQWRTEIWTTTLVRPGDMNGDLRVDTADLGALVTAFGRPCPSPCVADFNGDGAVDSADLGILISELNGVPTN